MRKLLLREGIMLTQLPLFLMLKGIFQKIRVSALVVIARGREKLNLVVVNDGVSLWMRLL